MTASLFRWLLAVAAVLLLFWGSLFLAYPIPVEPAAVLKAFSPGGDELTRAIVGDMRLPRSLVAVCLGANLAVAGALMQTITRNPLSSPSLLGVNAGASLGMVAVTAFSPAVLSGYSIAVVASVGGALSWLLVMSISGGGFSGADRNRVILAGITVSAFCVAATKAVLILADDHAFGIMNWLAGSIANASWEQWQVVFPFFLLGAAFCSLSASRLNVLGLSDESARSLGINLTRMRWYANIMSVLIVGSAVSVAGPVAFIGLLVPHLARYWVGYDLRKVLPMSMLLGAALMLAADILARRLAFPGEIPAGAVLALIGAPVFVYFARGRRS